MGFYIHNFNWVLCWHFLIICSISLPPLSPWLINISHNCSRIKTYFWDIWINVTYAVPLSWLFQNLALIIILVPFFLFLLLKFMCKLFTHDILERTWHHRYCLGFAPRTRHISEWARSTVWNINVSAIQFTILHAGVSIV